MFSTMFVIFVHCFNDTSGVVGRERMGTAFPDKKLSGNGVPTREILRDSFLVFFSFFKKTTYCCRTRRLSVRPSVRPFVRPSVEIISFRGNSLPNRPIELKIGLNVREGVVHVRKAWFFEILIASCKFMQFAIFCK